jgi:ketosteroid isomerase-like protein
MQARQLKDRATAFIAAHFAEDAAVARSLCSPSFESVVSAPIEIFPHLGRKQGRDWIDESIRQQVRRYSARQFEIVTALGDEDQVALLVRSKLTKRSDQRVINMMSAHTFRFVDGLIETHREFFDSFDLVEQLLGTDLSAEFADRLAKAV